MTKTYVITPVWNRADLTGRFLLQNHMFLQNVPDVQLVIVNNGSTDNTKEVAESWLERMEPGRLEVITLSENLGFSGGNNIGAAVANGDRANLIFLSNDVIIGGDYVTPLVKSIEVEPDALHGPERYDRDTGWNKFAEPVGVIPYLAGWCVACTAAFWRKIGGWDERYKPCDYEDVDLSYRVSNAKKRLIQVPNLPLRHESGQSARLLTGGRLAVTLESQRKFVEKWGLKR